MLYREPTDLHLITKVHSEFFDTNFSDLFIKHFTKNYRTIPKI